MNPTFKAILDGSGDILALLAGLVVVTFVGLLGYMILSRIWNNQINLSKLIAESNGDASMSRLQLLIFTFVIAMSFFLIVVGQDPFQFPQKFPAEVLTLLGISGSSYLVSKAIQSSSATKVTLGISSAPNVPLAPGGIANLTVSLLNAPSGGTVPPLTWSLDAPGFGTITPTGAANAVYTAPQAGTAPANTQVKVRAQAVGFEDGTVIVTLA